MRTDADVLVLGAGAAGLASARSLSQAGLHVAVLEARDRLGGRILTLREPALPIPAELGAEFVHGQPPEVWDIIRAAGLTVVEVDGEEWHYHDGRLRLLKGIWQEIEELMSRLEYMGEEDKSFLQFLDEHCQDLPEATRNLALSFIEGFHAAPASSASAKALRREHQGASSLDESRNARLVGGMDGLVRWLESQLDPQRVHIQRDATVTTVRWGEGSVTAEAVSGEGAKLGTFSAKRAIVTLPLGVLRRLPGAPGAVRFVPELPGKHEAAMRLEMGPVVKAIILFRDAFWETLKSTTVPDDASLSRLGIIVSSEEFFPTWWTTFPLRIPVLTGWAGGPAAERVVDLKPAEVLAHALETLSRILGIPRERIEERLLSWHLYDWQQDPFARGAYSYVPVGGFEARKQLASPVSDTLFFAGEATRFNGESGTVAGAIAPGLRAASEVLLSLGVKEEPSKKATT